MTPQREWGGKGLIGVTIRLDDYAGADERLIRVLSIEVIYWRIFTSLQAASDRSSVDLW